jgi:hypothetical protein
MSIEIFSKRHPSVLPLLNPASASPSPEAKSPGVATGIANCVIRRIGAEVGPCSTFLR